ncbi:hypothetical protein JCM10213v2_004909 [Rhodosporidiobolus nylandii]
MAASLARTVFKPAPSRGRIAASAAPSSVCPVARLLPGSAACSSTGARTVNAVAHVTVAAAVVASLATLASRPDPLPFDHAPRSAISWQPAVHIRRAWPPPPPSAAA